MVDLKNLSNNLELMKNNIKSRNMDCDLDAILKLQNERSEMLQVLDAKRAKRNEIAKKMKSKLEQEERNSLINQGKEIKIEISELEDKAKKINDEYLSLASTLPNYLDPKSPIGNEEDSVVIKKVGKVPSFDFEVKDHVELGEKLDLIDFETASKVSGSKFYYLKNEAVLLELALINYAISTVIKHGFTPFITPDIAKTDIVSGIGFNPRGNESNIYSIEDTGTCLVGTAEITLGGYYANSIIDEKDLPIKMSGFSHCFRREAGASGQFSKGLYRVHQFSKVEMFIICKEDQSEEFHKKLLEIEEEIYSSLGIAYRVLDIASGDLGAPAARKFDIEAWMPKRNDYGEVTSASNCTDYQSRSLNIRYKDKDGNNKFVHMLNGTVIAISRAIVAILENYQNKDGSITIPKVLVPYMGIKEIRR